MKNWFRQERQLLIRFYQETDYGMYAKQVLISFIALSILSFILGSIWPAPASRMVGFFVQQMDGIANDNGTISALSLFSNNLQAAAFCVLYGFIPFIFLPALSLGINSILLGFMGAYSVAQGESLLYYLIGVLPHGIFEIPALCLSISCGIYLCTCVNQRIRYKKVGAVKTGFRQVCRIFWMHIVPLLLVAAVIEAYVTLFLLNQLK